MKKFSLNIKLWVSLTVRVSVFVTHCCFSSFRTPRIRRGLLLLLLLLSGPLPITDLNTNVFWKTIFTTQRYFGPLSCFLTFFPQHQVVGLNVRVSVFVPHCWFSSFRTPHIRRGLLLLLLLSFGPLPITDLVLPSSLGGDFHYTTIFWTLIVLPNLFPST